MLEWSALAECPVIVPHQGGLVQLPRNFTKPMGLAVDGNRLAVARRHEVVVLVNNPRLTAFHPTGPGHYDALLVPRSGYYVNELVIPSIDVTLALASR